MPTARSSALCGAICALLLAVAVQAAELQFQLVFSYPGGEGIYDIQAADLNRDGRADLVSAAYNGKQLVLRLNDGTGQFPAALTYAGGSPCALAIADLDGDGNQDVASANYDQGTISVRRGAIDGALQPPVDYAVGTTVRDLVAADFDGDGFLDLAAVQSSGRVRLLRGHGAAGFDAAVTLLQPGGLLKAIAAADLDGDGKVDLAIVDYANKRVIPLRNAGGMTFATLPALTAGAGASDVVLADFDGDGDRDVAITNEDGTAVVFHNSGVAVFGSRAAYAIGHSSQSMAAGDFDRDGRADLLVSNYQEGTVQVLPGIGAGFFGAAVATVLWGSPRCTAVADFDGNGELDVATGDQAGSVRVLSDDGTPATAVLAPAGAYEVGVSNPRVHLTDLGGDGRPDIVLAERSDGRVAVLKNTGTGFAPATYATCPRPSSLTSGDFNNDGRRDIVTVSYDFSSLSLLLGQAGGGLAAPITFTAGTGVQDVTTTDVTGDGIDDVAYVVTGKVVWRKGVGFNGLGNPVSIVAGGADLTGIAAADLTGDGRPELAVVGPHENIVRVLLNQSGTYTTWLNLATDPAPNTVDVGDIDHDGKVDIVVGTQQGAVDVFMNLGGGLWATRKSASIPAAACQSVDLADYDGDSILDVLVATSPSDELHVFTVGADLSLHHASVQGAGPMLRWAAAGDVTGDGLPDAVVADDGTGFVHVYANARGTLVPPPPPPIAACTGLRFGFPDRPTQVVVGDFDGDGVRDLAASTESGQASFQRGLPDTPSGPREDMDIAPGAQSIAAADLDGDGVSELVVTDTEGRSLRVFRRSAGAYHVLADLDVGDHPRYVIAADLDRDGRIDLASANDAGDLASGTVTILFNPPGTSWLPVPEPVGDQVPLDPAPIATGPGGGAGDSEQRIDLPVGVGPLALTAADLDGDGELDLVVNERGGTLSILYALGGGRFHPAQTLAVPGSSTSVADLDGDGRPDLAVADTGGDALHVLYNTAVDPWTSGLVIPTEDAPLGVFAMDVNTDGLPDLSYATSAGAFGLRLATPAHTFRDGFPCGAGGDARGLVVVPRVDGGVDAYIVSRAEDSATLRSLAPAFFGRQGEPETQAANAIVGTAFGLEPPRPNPATAAATIAFGLPARAHVRVGVYDVRGRLVSTLADRDFDPGRHELRWDGRDSGGARVHAGIYFWRMTSSAGTRTERQVLLAR